MFQWTGDQKNVTPHIQHKSDIYCAFFVSKSYGQEEREIRRPLTPHTKHKKERKHGNPVLKIT
jgi:hypothetical protein